MATMLPNSIDPETPSDGEILVFKTLRDDPFTSKWVVLHSLDIANHPSQISGEVDFVVIIPNNGVVCVEVKADRRVSRDKGGNWHLGSKKSEKRGPFKQSSNGMHAVKDFIADQESNLRSLVVWSCVIFTHAHFKETSIEWHDWQCINKDKIRIKSISRLILDVINEGRKLLEAKSTTGWFKSSKKHPNMKEVEQIQEVLRPQFEFFESPTDRKNRVQSEIKRYTDEQFLALDRISDNPRIAILGPAGCGKTLLAVEAARRGAASGKKVLITCYNNLLGDWIEKQTDPIRDQVVAGNSSFNFTENCRV